MSGMKILEWRALHKNSLVGFAKVEMPSGMIFNDVAIMSGENGYWASPPSKLMIGRDGAPMKDRNGKDRRSPIVEFTAREVRDRWSEAIISALLEAHGGDF